MLAGAGDPANKAHRRCSEITVYSIHAILLFFGIIIVIIIIVTITTMCFILISITNTIIFRFWVPFAGFEADERLKVFSFRNSELLLVVLSEHARRA